MKNNKIYLFNHKVKKYIKVRNKLFLLKDKRNLFDKKNLKEIAK